LDKQILKLSSEELEVLFEESGYVQNHFFPPEVPTIPAFEELKELPIESVSNE